MHVCVRGCVSVRERVFATKSAQRHNSAAVNVLWSVYPSQRPPDNIYFKLFCVEETFCSIFSINK